VYLLDTNVVSELRKAGTGRADPSVVRWAASVDPAALHLSAVSVLEIEIGILRVTRRDRVQGDLLRRWLEGQVFAAFAGRILPVDVSVAMRCAQVLVLDPKADRDALIAATAHVHGFTVVTRNTADFRSMDVRLVDPWSTE
jgi:predicted nucleic acid-binding protein